MGWDAYATYPSGRYLLKNWRTDHRLTSNRLRTAFEQASAEVEVLTGDVDWMLATGGLDVSTCGELLYKATGFSAWDEKGWSPRKVKRANHAAIWDFEVPKDDLVPYWSARKFLEVCAELGLGIRFSY